jgi:hypothetical protein
MLTIGIGGAEDTVAPAAVAQLVPASAAMGVVALVMAAGLLEALYSMAVAAAVGGGSMASATTGCGAAAGGGAATAAAIAGAFGV